MITSRDNDIIKDAVKLLGSSRYRRKTSRFVCEGLRLCGDAVISGVRPSVLLYTDEASKKYDDRFDRILTDSQRSFEISIELYKKISDTVEPQGVMCIFDIPDIKFDVKPGGKYAALENIQDPSNMGTILRTAEALGIDGVILSGGCCDIYSPKTLRGSMGAVFRLPVFICDDLPGYVSELNSRGISTYASTPHDAGSIRDVDFSCGGVMLIGNEGNGLSDEAINACSHRVKIPMRGRAESLNAAAAAAILLYSLS